MAKTHLNSEHILYLIFHMCQYSSVFFGNSTKIKYEKVCISPNNISNGYKIIKLITRFLGSTPRTRFQETSGSVCSAAIFSETSAPFLMRGVFSIPQKSRAERFARPRPNNARFRFSSIKNSEQAGRFPFCPPKKQCRSSMPQLANSVPRAGNGLDQLRRKANAATMAFSMVSARPTSSWQCKTEHPFPLPGITTVFLRQRAQRILPAHSAPAATAKLTKETRTRARSRALPVNGTSAVDGRRSR